MALWFITFVTSSRTRLLFFQNMEQKLLQTFIANNYYSILFVVHLSCQPHWVHLCPISKDFSSLRPVRIHVLQVKKYRRCRYVVNPLNMLSACRHFFLVLTFQIIFGLLYVLYDHLSYGRVAWWEYDLGKTMRNEIDSLMWMVLYFLPYTKRVKNQGSSKWGHFLKIRPCSIPII